MMSENSPILLGDIDAERVLLSAVMGENRFADIAGLDADHFFDPSHSKIWKAITDSLGRGNRASIATLAGALPDLASYIAGLGAPLGPIGGVAELVATIRDFAARRQMHEIGCALMERAGNMSSSPADMLTQTGAELDRIQFAKASLRKSQIAQAVLEGLDCDLPIFPTGIIDLDAALGGGLIAGKLYGVGARKKVGKTILLGTISHNLNRAETRHLFVSLEMSPVEIEQRNIAREKGFNSIRFLTRDMPNLAHKVGAYIRDVPDATLYEHAPGITLLGLRAKIAQAAKQGITGVILDYLQLVGGRAPKDTEEAHLRAISQWLADYARQSGLWVLTAAQLNQDDNVRGGEGLKLAADAYLVLHREKENPGAWLEMQESRYTLYANVGSETLPGLWLHKAGPHFSDTPPPYSDMQSHGAAA
jgi:replicative DNA helicase